MRFSTLFASICGAFFIVTVVGLPTEGNSRNVPTDIVAPFDVNDATISSPSTHNDIATDARPRGCGFVTFADGIGRSLVGDGVCRDLGTSPVSIWAGDHCHCGLWNRAGCSGFTDIARGPSELNLSGKNVLSVNCFAPAV